MAKQPPNSFVCYVTKKTLHNCSRHVDIVFDGHVLVNTNNYIVNFYHHNKYIRYSFDQCSLLIYYIATSRLSCDAAIFDPIIQLFSFPTNSTTDLIRDGETEFGEVKQLLINEF